jgi:outer membrane protein insertion porin family
LITGQEKQLIKLLKKKNKIMLKIYITIFFLIFLNLSAEIIQKLNVSGNDRISDETIKVYGDISIGKNYSSSEVNKILKSLYNTDFFEDVKISLENNVLNISVKEYSVINFVDIEGESSKTVKKSILKQLSLKQKESFIQNKLSQDIDLIKKIYASIGYNFANVEAKIEKFDNNRINLLYFLTKGKKTNIAEINFIGDKKIKDKRLRDIIVSEEKKFWKFLSKNTFLNNRNIELDKRLLISYYKSQGYYDVQVLSSNAVISKENFTKLTYTINAGTRYRINKISTNVSDVIDKKIFVSLKDDFTKIIGKYYSPFNIKKLLDEVDILIANNDLQFVEHSVNEIIEGNSIEVKINIFEGQKKLVERIDIVGNSVTDEAVIRAELLIDEGDPFNNLKFEQSIARLKARNLFATVKKRVTNGLNVNQKVIEIEVEEKPTGEISAGAGIGTNGASIEFSITENNWLGKGVAISTNAAISAESFTGGLQVTNPNHNFSGNSLSYFVSNTTNDKADSGYKNNIITTGVGTKFEQYKSVYISPTISLSHDNLKVQSTASESLKKQKGKFTDLTLDYGISLDKRDRVYDPTDGYISKFSQGLPIYADSPSIKNSYQFSKYKTLTKDAIGTFKIYASSVTGLSNKDVRLNKRAKLSSSRLRGFEAGKIGPKDGFDYVGGNYAMASNFEVKLPNLLPESTKTDVGLFLDFGNVWSVDYDKTIDDSNKIRSTAGVNTSWLSPAGPMTFVFSQNLSQAATDVVETFNFKLGTTF